MIKVPNFIARQSALPVLLSFAFGKGRIGSQVSSIFLMPIDLTAPEQELRDRFFDLKKPEDIADLLELTSYNFLEYTIFVQPISKKYSHFKIPKKRGGKRIIQEPTPNLKIIQHKLLQVLQAVYETQPSVHGFALGRSIVTNAAPHVGSRYILNIDLMNFFPSIHFGRVRGMFMAYPYYLPSEVATVLAQICSLPMGLPQGAPTSPIISNMLCAKMDSQLQKLAKKHHCYYTRYADDLTFSTTRRKFPAALAVIISDEDDRYVRIGDELRSIIDENGFKINQQKVRLQTRTKRQEVTGLTTNKFVNVNRKFIRQIRAMLHAWNKYGYEAAENEYHQKYCYKQPDKSYKTLASFRQVIKGKIEFIRMVRGREDGIYIKFNNRAAQLERDANFSTYLFNFLASPDQEIMSLIAGGETNNVEFKVGACLDMNNKENKKKMFEKILREVVAFMNSEPTGTILIGVADNGKIEGVEREYKVADPQKGNWDGYELFLTNKLNDLLSGSNPSNFYRISRHQVNGKVVCSIKTTKADKPILANEKLYIRSGTQSKELKGEDKINFILEWKDSD